LKAEGDQEQTKQATADVEADLGLTDPTTLSPISDLRSSTPSPDPSLLDAHREGINDVPDGRH
jgi:hypothetical protein